MKVKIHSLTYIFLLISFLSGYFEYMYILILIIFIHESGHYFFSKLVGVKKQEIIIHPFGGMTILHEALNIKLYKEFIFLLGGILFQLLLYLLIYILYNNAYISDRVFSIFSKINFLLISFNFLTILPLDGGRLLNIILNKFFNYKLSYKISYITSIIFILIFFILKRTVLAFILSLLLLNTVINEILSINMTYTKFLFERYIYKIKFKKNKNISNINSFKRDYNHTLNGIKEEVLLYKMFDMKKRIC